MHNGIRSYNIGIFENTMAKIKEKMKHEPSAVCTLSGLLEVELIEKIRDAVASGRVVV